jgi:hypothetical protein
MKQNRIITISEHAVDRFIERFEFAGKNTGNESDVRFAAERAIVSIWQSASYVSDDHSGILFRNRDFFCDMIVFNRMIKTLFPTKGGALQPENHSTTDLRIKGEMNNSRFRKQSKTGGK